MALAVIGNCLQFDGSTQYANRAIVSLYTDNFSIVLWVKVSAYGAGDACFFNNGSNDTNGYELRINSSGVFSFDISFVANLSSGYTLSTDTWYQLAVIRNGGTAQCYVNANAQGGTSASTPNTPSNWITIGASQNAAGTVSRYANAKIDDVRFYGRPISTSELTQLYNRAFNTRLYEDIDTGSLTSWWKFDENTGTTCASNGTSTLALTTSGNPPFVQGIVEARQETKSLYNNKRPRPFAPGIAR